MDASSVDLIVDVGNTRSKLALFHGDRLQERIWLDTGDSGAWKKALERFAPQRIALGSVAGSDPSLMELLRERAPTFLITGTTPAPLISQYTTPSTLGVDRLANAVAAAALFPHRAVVAVDLGTCITYDLIHANGVYAGGAITPGVLMRSKAMNAYSARLPFVDLPEEVAALGISTQGSLEAGVHHGVLGEIKEFIRLYTHRSQVPAVVLTGGDALRFARALKRGIFAHPFLTLEGLRLILHHHLANAGALAGDPVR